MFSNFLFLQGPIKEINKQKFKKKKICFQNWLKKFLLFMFPYLGLKFLEKIDEIFL
jgi:hypothetical protein